MTIENSQNPDSSRGFAPDDSLNIQPGDGETPPGLTAPKGHEAAPEAESAVEKEETLWVGRTAWKHFGGFIVACFATAMVILVVAGVWLPAGFLYGLGLVVVGAVVAVGRIALTIFSTRYRLTTERLFIDRGILHQTIDQIELIRVDDIRVTKRLVDRIFGLGSVEILSTDSSDRSIEITGVVDADHVAELVRSRMRTARRKSLFIENL